MPYGHGMQALTHAANRHEGSGLRSWQGKVETGVQRPPEDNDRDVLVAMVRPHQGCGLSAQ